MTDDQYDLDRLCEYLPFIEGGNSPGNKAMLNETSIATLKKCFFNEIRHDRLISSTLSLVLINHFAGSAKFAHFMQVCLYFTFYYTVFNFPSYYCNPLS